MGTLRGVWKRLTELLESALQGKQRAAKADPKKGDAAARQFTAKFQPVLAKLEKHYQAKAALEQALKATVTEGLAHAQELKKGIAAANQDGYTQGTLKEDLEGRMDELIDRLKELQRDGFGVQWD